MKANEAPEKIYVNITHPISNEYTEIIAFEDGDGIEYTRTDVFIEKAKEFLLKESNIPLWDDIGENFGCDTPKLVENFIKYMKGE